MIWFDLKLILSRTLSIQSNGLQKPSLRDKHIVSKDHLVNSLGLMVSRGTNTLARDTSCPLPGLDWLRGRTGDRERNRGLSSAWLLIDRGADHACIPSDIIWVDVASRLKDKGQRKCLEKKPTFFVILPQYTTTVAFNIPQSKCDLSADW